jgi:hypothetical protein
MTTGRIWQAEAKQDRFARQLGRVIATLIGALLMIIAAFVDWTPFRSGDELTDKALVQADFSAQDDFVKAVGGICVLIALVALLGLADRSGWVTRLAGAASLVLFVMFVVQAYRFYGNDLGTALDRIQAGPWLVLCAAAVLLLGGFLGARREVRTPAVVANYDARRDSDRHD